MSDVSLVITGSSTVSSLGIGNDLLPNGLDSGGNITNIKKFDFHEFDHDIPCFQIPDFDPCCILGKKGMRTKDRATKILLSTLEMGFKERLDLYKEKDKPGIVVGTSFGSVQSIGDFLSDSIVNGVNAVNPMLFANTVINSPTGQANIRYDVKTLSTTISTGFNSGIDAVIYACDYIKRGYSPVIITGGLEELSYYSILGLKLSGTLSQTNTIQPFSKNADGIIVGEGCAMFSIETEKNAETSGKKILAEIAGYSNAFDPNQGRFGFNPSGEGAKYTIEQALYSANIRSCDIDFIVSNASGNPYGDDMESNVITSIFNNTPVVAYKIKTGECYGASGPLSLACALSDMKNSRITGTGVSYETRNNINLVSETKNKFKSRYVLVTSFSCDGYCSSIIIKKHD
ncbi:MAG: beta-ketoacyl synthase N-terminal-like domain-containing protein [Chitinispirillia bacterium]|jgi:3-oxoacyl-(acyl-carrier-protein) synthase